MKNLFLSLLILGFGISGSLGQTIKSLGYNTSNGQIVASTNITFTNAIGFTTNASSATRSNLGFSTNLNDLWEASDPETARNAFNMFRPMEAASDGSTWWPTNAFSQELPATMLASTGLNVDGGSSYGTGGFAEPIPVLYYSRYNDGLGSEPTDAYRGWHIYDSSGFRNAIGFSANFSPFWTATNASNARSALELGSGITTNRSFVSYNGTNYTTNSVTISNGIITGWTQ